MKIRKYILKIAILTILLMPGSTNVYAEFKKGENHSAPVPSANYNESSETPVANENSSDTVTGANFDKKPVYETASTGDLYIAQEKQLQKEEGGNLLVTVIKLLLITSSAAAVVFGLYYFKNKRVKKK